MHPSHETRMHVARRVWQDEIAEFAVDIRKVGCATRKLRLKARADLVRYRLPDRSIPDVGGVVDHIVEHAMT